MKKLFSLISVLALAGAVSTASAADREGNFGIGFQESFTSGTSTANGFNSAGAWSLKYGIASNITTQATIGFDLGKNIDKRFNVGLRVLYDVVENENSDFYIGAGALYDRNNDTDALRVSVPLGFEFSFAGLPEIGFSAEAGLVLDFSLEDGNDTARISSVGGNVGGALGLGVHYYF